MFLIFKGFDTQQILFILICYAAKQSWQENSPTIIGGYFILLCVA
jgi:hypothetical protein